MLKSFKDLIVWQKALRLCVHLYKESKRFPSEERFGLTSQLRRAGVSVPSNIAEGYGRGTTRDYVRFLRTAKGSLAELETQVILAKELEYLSASQMAAATPMIEEVVRMLKALIHFLEAKELRMKN